MKPTTTTLAALMVCALTTTQSRADLTWQGGSGNWFNNNWTDGVTSNMGWSGSVAYIGNVGAAPSSITLNGWVGADIHTYNGGYLNTNGNGLTGSIYVEDISLFAIIGNNLHPGGLALAKGSLQLGYGGNETPVGGDMVVNGGYLGLAAQSTSGKTIAGNLHVNGGDVHYQFNNQIGDTAFIYARGGTIDLRGKSDTVGGLELSSGSVISDGTLTSASTYDVRKGSVSAVLAGSGGLTKTTADTVTLSNTNTYTGATTVSTGTLKVSGSIATSDVTVNGGILASGSSGTVGKNVTVNSGATFAAGDVGTVGAATVANDLNFSSGSIFDWDLTTATNSYDTVSVTGALSITSGAKFNVVSSTAFTDTFWDASHTWTDIFGAKTIDNFLVSNFLYSGSATAPSAEGFFTVSGTNLTWTAVPEPTSALAGLLLTVGLLRRRRA